MLLNFGKCKCVHIGHGNKGDTILGKNHKKGLMSNINFSADMNVSEQCGIAASKGNTILELIRITIT